MKHVYDALKAFFLLLVFAIPQMAQGQMDTCNVYLQGKYLEAGINWNGAFGSSSTAPSGYHPKSGGSSTMEDCNGNCYSGSSNIAFVADPDEDGWSFGYPYHYIGDYCLPGNPQEGWSIMADGVQANVWNGYACGTSPSICDSRISGSNVSYTSSGNLRIATWEGAFDSLKIDQIVTLDVNTLYLKMELFLTNTGAVARKNIYYLRTIDPDNTAADGGQFATINKIENALPNPLGRTVISALGLDASNAPVNSAYLALGSNDCRARCFKVMGSLYPEWGTLDTMYGMEDTVHYSYKGTDTLDAAIGLVFKVGDLAPGSVTAINFSYIFRKTDIDSVLNTAPAYWTAAGNSTKYASGDTATTCQNMNIGVNIFSGLPYTWHWFSPSGASISPSTGSSVSVSIGSIPVNLIAIGTSDCLGNDTLRMTLNPILPTITPSISISGPFFERVGKPVTINATVGGVSGPYQIQWTNNGLIFTSTAAPSVTYTKAPGIDKIKAIITPLSSGCYATDTSSLWVVGANTSAVNNVNNVTEIKVSPNPFINMLNATGLKRGDVLSIYDAAGRLVNRQGIVNDEQQQTIQLNDLAAGYYILNVFDADNNMRASIPLQKIK